MALRDIFKFRELPESETSKPFLEHLEDLRWTIVKMAITLIAAMIICFAFRGTLVRVMQAPLHEIDQNLGVLRALGITDSIVISFHLAFYAGIVISFPLLLFFAAEFVLPALDRDGEKISVPGHRHQLRPFPDRCACLLFLAAAQNDPFLFSRHAVARLGSELDGASNIIRL